jgi:hypothetical protein
MSAADANAPMPSHCLVFIELLLSLQKSARCADCRPDTGVNSDRRRRSLEQM